MATAKTKSKIEQNFLKRAFVRCGNLLHRLMEYDESWVFSTPVDVKGMRLKEYYKIVKHPMDFGTVKRRLEKGLYLSPVQFARDVKLTLNNAMLYNGNGEPAYDMAQKLSQFFLKEWSSIKAEFISLLSYDDMILRRCESLLNRLLMHPYGMSFHTLVDVDLEGYYDIVRRPIDLGRIKIKLENVKYSSPLEFAEDVKLTFDNAMLYFDEGRVEYIMAEELLQIFNKEWASIKADFAPLLDDDLF